MNKPLGPRTAVDDSGLGPDVEAWLPGAGAPPMFIERKGEALAAFPAFRDWAAAHRDRLDALILEHGGIVLRGFPVASAEEFDALMSLFPRYQPGYVAGMSPRKPVTGRILESTRLAENYKIRLHSEMAYMSRFPPRIAFFCRKAAEVGGETIIGSMQEFMQRFPPELLEKVERHGVQVVRNFAPAGASRGAESLDHPDLVGWDEAFYTESREEVEAHCQKLGIEPEWNEDGSLTLRERYGAITRHPITGERFYRANLHVNHTFEQQGFGDVADKVRQAQKTPTGHYLGNGEMLSRAEVEQIDGALEAVERAWRWQDGDLMILDNLLTAHGRNAFSGPREVMVALLDAPEAASPAPA